jgi:hypothetical protein
MTKRTSRKASMSSSGLPRIAMMSAARPGLIGPRSFSSLVERGRARHVASNRKPTPEPQNT